LNYLAASQPQFLTAFVSGLVTPTTSVVAAYHDDVPLVLPSTFSQYEPDPITVLSQVATAGLRVSNLYQAIEVRKAQDRSQAEPRWGLHEGREGVLVGIKKKVSPSGRMEIVLEMELRRRSGRAVGEKFILGFDVAVRAESLAPASVTLLSDHPAFARPINVQAGDRAADDDAAAGATFNLGLTEKQRLDREGVVLPYFDAQSDIGSGEGGRIIYEMGREDDFDDEEDEI
jgi:elongator complex protein 5